MLKKLALGATLAVALLLAPRIASAGVDVSIGIGLPFPGVIVAPPPPVVVRPPVVVAPPPVVVGPADYGPSYVRVYPPGKRHGWHKHGHKHKHHHHHHH